MSYYFVKVPKLPKEVSHQMGTVELVEYLVRENGKIEKGQAIATVKNWWAQMVLKSVGSGYLSKTFFESGTYIRVGDPIAIVVCDPEDGPRNQETCTLEVTKVIRVKQVQSEL
jgi:pyruvate/2-oxoglutarate dehydrogenase complex dihydrolipoamide acyltransferase (E2) component